MVKERYFYVEGDRIGAGRIRLSDDESHHLARVIRLQEGAVITLLDGRGNLYKARIVSFSASMAELEVVERERAEPPRRIDLALAVTKAHCMDTAVEKCTEIGLRRIIPFRSTRSVWRGGDREAARKRDRLSRKVIAACKQSGHPYFPDVAEVGDFDNLCDRISSYGTVFLADRKRGGGGFAAAGTVSEPVLCIVGPEGGLDEHEIGKLTGLGAVPVSLGLFRLRSETAAICAVFLVHTILSSGGSIR